MWIKICGITSVEDAELAVAAGADALGFIFAESPRCISPEAVREIIADASTDQTEKIGVFVNASVEEMFAVQRLAGLTGMQLHGSGHVDVEQLRDYSSNNSNPIRILRVMRYDAHPDRFALELRQLRESATFDGRQNAILVDTCVAGKQGGTGVAFDWSAARDTFLHEAPYFRLIAAGGLHPGNVREAIQTLRPWGVDVSSGVESSPGKKDPELLAAFIREARAAEMELAEAARL